MGTSFPSPGLKRMVREVNHSPSPSVEVKNEWRYTSAPPYCLHGLDKEKCTFFSFIFLHSSLKFYFHLLSMQINYDKAIGLQLSLFES